MFTNGNRYFITYKGIFLQIQQCKKYIALAISLKMFYFFKVVKV